MGVPVRLGGPNGKVLFVMSGKAFAIVFCGIAALCLAALFGMKRCAAERKALSYFGSVVRADDGTPLGGAVLHFDHDGFAYFAHSSNPWVPGRFEGQRRPLPESRARLSIVAPGFAVLEQDVVFTTGPQDLGVFRLVPLPPAETREATVEVMGAELDTGIDVTGGERLHLEARGDLRVGQDSWPPGGKGGAAGKGGGPAEFLRRGSLLFRVGEGPWEQGDAKVQHLARRSGRLRLCANLPVALPVPAVPPVPPVPPAQGSWTVRIRLERPTGGQ